MPLNSQSLLCCAVSSIIFQFRRLNPIEKSFGIGAALTLLVTVHHAFMLAVARSSKTEVKARLQYFGVQYSLGINFHTYCSKPRERRTEDFTCSRCRDGTCTFIARGPAYSHASIPVTGPIFTGSIRIAGNVEF